MEEIRGLDKRIKY